MKKSYLAPSLNVYSLNGNDIITASGDDQTVAFKLDWLDQNGGFGGFEE